MSALDAGLLPNGRPGSCRMPGRLGAQRVALTGTFEPSAEAAFFSAAPLFKRPVDIMARFSSRSTLAPGHSAIGPGWPKDLLLVFDVPGRMCFELQTHSYDAFPGRSVDELADLLRLLRTHTLSDDQALGAAFAGRPAGLRFLACAKRAPISYSTTRYHALDTFVLTEGPQTGLRARFRFEPPGGEHHFVAETTSRLPAGYLARELHERIGANPVAFEWTAQIAADYDGSDDPTVPWPERGRIHLGRLVLSEVCPDFFGLRGSGSLLDGLVPALPAPTKILADALIRTSGEL